MNCITIQTHQIRSWVSRLHSLPSDKANSHERQRLTTAIFNALGTIDQQAAAVAEVFTLLGNKTERKSGDLTQGTPKPPSSPLNKKTTP